MVMLGNIPGTYIYHNLYHYKEAVRVPGFLILSIEAPINFANTTYLKERISRWIEDYVTEEEETKKHFGLHFVILDLFAVNAIDTSGVSFLKDLRMAMEKKGLEARNIDFLFIYLLVMVNPLGVVMEKLQRADESREFMRPDALFLTIGEAVTTLNSTIKSQSSNNV
ncbi:unnamed protein product [Ilex paraguariensis]|uniref:STAS domain-containing protein n=1 Tax=Ilex paraguariensis TaxID=185542 RepID=A0ABC8RQT3_9AQUA